MGMSDTDRLRHAKLERMVARLRGFGVSNPEMIAEAMLEEIEIAQIQEFERWHEVARNTPEPGKEE